MLNLPFKNDHYGYRFAQRDELGRFHPGVDFNGPGVGDADQGIPVRSIGPGVVTFVGLGYNSGWGNHVYVKHDMAAYFKAQGVEMPSWCPAAVWTHYAHLQDGSVGVKVGQTVTGDTVIGKNGHTGSNPKGRSWTAHLHWEVRKRPLGVNYYPPKAVSAQDFNGMYFDPEEFVADVNKWVEAKKAAVPTQNDVIAEAAARTTADEKAIVEMASLLVKAGRSADVDRIMAALPWIPKA